jgi:hypothetical protein
MSPLVNILLGPVMDIINKVIPDPVAKAEAQLKVLQMQQAGELKQLEADVQMALGQVEINKIEAGSESLFKSGWRPAVGWTCALAFAAKFIGGPALFVLAQFIPDMKPIVLPPIDMTEMLPLLLGMLGLGTLRSWDKKNGV